MTRIFSVVAADPAWQCKDQLPGNGRGASKKYTTMKTDAIGKLARTFVRYRGDDAYRQLYLEMSGKMMPIADDAILFLWRIASMVTDALQVISAWGFVAKSEVVWAKYRPCVDCRGRGRGVAQLAGKRHAWVCELCEGTGCGTPWFGMGRYTRHAHETCVIATRGKMASKITDHSISSVLHAPMPWNHETNRPIHSAKPEVFYTDIVEPMAPGPYLELFARARRRGWTTLGNQVGQRRVA